MQEIGGYIELDTYHLPMLHEEAIALNCGRNALAWLIRAYGIKKLWIPGVICNSIPRVCEREEVSYSFYSIGMDFLPENEIKLQDNEWIYFVNYYSQISQKTIIEYVRHYKRIIVDNAQSYFQMPVENVDTLYSCRKYFGVPDGAFLYSATRLCEEIPIDESFERMRFLLGRFERTAAEFYKEYTENNQLFTNEPVKYMSKLTENLLHGIDYASIKKRREENYLNLDSELHHRNKLRLADYPGTFMYPFMVKNGDTLRKELQKERIYIPILWPGVSEQEDKYLLTKNILPLPIDQRYDEKDMKKIIKAITKMIDE